MNKNLLQLQITHYIFKRNFEELENVFNYIENTENLLQIMDINKKELFQKYMFELCCKIHNFEMSVYTLIDHTRNFVNENYVNTQFQQDYQDKLNDCIIKNTLCSFVKDFRNYCTHFCIPNISISLVGEFGENLENNFNNKVILNKEELLKFNNWSKQANEYIEKNNNIDLKNTLQQYNNIITEFYSWFYLKLE